MLACHYHLESIVTWSLCYESLDLNKSQVACIYHYRTFQSIFAAHKWSVFYSIYPFLIPTLSNHCSLSYNYSLTFSIISQSSSHLPSVYLVGKILRYLNTVKIISLFLSFIIFCFWALSGAWGLVPTQCWEITPNCARYGTRTYRSLLCLNRAL